jgi:hypothetical protein
MDMQRMLDSTGTASKTSVGLHFAERRRPDPLLGVGMKPGLRAATAAPNNPVAAIMVSLPARVRRVLLGRKWRNW